MREVSRDGSRCRTYASRRPKHKQGLSRVQGSNIVKDVGALIRIILLSISLASALSAPATAQEIPKDLRQGMPYTQARALLLRAGWQASFFNKAILQHLDRVLQAWYLDHGFMEVEECTPTGSGLCTAIFHNATGSKLYVFTAGGDRESGAYKAPGPVITSFCLDRLAVNCSTD